MATESTLAVMGKVVAGFGLLIVPSELAVSAKSGGATAVPWTKE